ncbi:hypothetical protein WEH80_28960 [Actinomycetes bacterium KLBMP 9759]
MPRFRLFGRAQAEPPAPPPQPPPQPPPGFTQRPPRPPGGGPATRAARPAAPRNPYADPPTDPTGFPPVPAPRRADGATPMPDPAEAAALAGAFAVDYLSWDEEDPQRRGRVLADHLASPGSDPARLGWSGTGRQRADFALTGLVRPDGDGRVLVDVRVRVTPYRPVGKRAEPPAEPEREPAIPGVPAVAPPPTGRGWRSLAAHWIRLSVPVVLSGGRLVVDAWEETLGEEPAPPTTPPTRSDHALTDDDPLAAQQLAGGPW